MARIANDLDYPNFKDEVAKTLGKNRAKRYGQIWSALYDMPEDLPEPEAEDSAQTDWPGVPPKGKAVAYGGIVVDRRGRILLRKVRGGFDGYGWTFAKGRPDPGETPRTTALREVLEETGVAATVIVPLRGDFAGGTTTNRYFLMVADEGKVSLDHQCKETDGLRWAFPDEARHFISDTANLVGRARDLSLVDAVAEWLTGSVPFERPVVLRHAAKRRPMPAARTELALGDALTQSSMARLWRGTIDATSDDPWFAYFEDKVLHLHRRQTGFEIYRAFFEPQGDGWLVSRVEANRHPAQHGGATDVDDIAQLRALIRRVAETPNGPGKAPR